MLEGSFLRNLRRSMIYALCMAIIATAVPLYYGNQTLAVSLLLATLAISFGWVARLWSLHRWSSFCLPEDMFVLGWDEHRPYLVKDTQSIREGALAGLRPPFILVHVRPMFQETCSIVFECAEGRWCQIDRRVTVTLAGVTASSVEQWLLLSRSTLKQLLCNAAKEFAEGGEIIDESDPFSVDRLSRSIESYIHHSRDWIRGLLVTIDPPSIPCVKRPEPSLSPTPVTSR